MVNDGLRKELHSLKFGHGNPTSEREREAYESELAFTFLFPIENQGITKCYEGHSNVKIVGQNIETDVRVFLSF